MRNTLFNERDIPKELRKHFDKVDTECGSPWVRVVEKEFISQPDIKNPNKLIRDPNALDASSSLGGAKRGSNDTKTIGWEKSCGCLSDDPLDGIDGPRAPFGTKPCIVLDPFFGSGTTGIVAYKHGRKFIGIELSEEYLTSIAIPRIEKTTKQLKLWN